MPTSHEGERMGPGSPTYLIQGGVGQDWYPTYLMYGGIGHDWYPTYLIHGGVGQD